MTNIDPNHEIILEDGSRTTVAEILKSLIPLEKQVNETSRKLDELNKQIVSEIEKYTALDK